MTGSFRLRASLLLLVPLLAGGCLDVTPFTYSTVRVQVNDETGAGLPSVHVVFYTTGRVVDDQLTDAGGRATFIRVPLGNFGVGVEPPAGYSIPSGRSDHTDALFIPGGTDTTFTFVFNRACCGGSQVRVAANRARVTGGGTAGTSSGDGRQPSLQASPSARTVDPAGPAGAGEVGGGAGEGVGRSALAAGKPPVLP